MSQLDREDNGCIEKDLEDTNNPDIEYHQPDNVDASLYEDGNSLNSLEDFTDIPKSEGISEPKNFKHVTHTQYDKARGIKIKVIDPDLKEKFEPFVGGGGEAVLTSLIGRKDDKIAPGNIRGGKKPPKLSKEDIGSPTNYVHVSHCGAEPMQKETMDLSCNINDDVFDSVETSNDNKSGLQSPHSPNLSTDTTDSRPMQLAQQKIPFRSTTQQRKNLPPPPPLPPGFKEEDDSHSTATGDYNQNTAEVDDYLYKSHRDSSDSDNVSESYINFPDNLSGRMMTTEL